MVEVGREEHSLVKGVEQFLPGDCEDGDIEYGSGGNMCHPCKFTTNNPSLQLPGRYLYAGTDVVKICLCLWAEVEDKVKDAEARDKAETVGSYLTVYPAVGKRGRRQCRCFCSR